MTQDRREEVKRDARMMGILVVMAVIAGLSFGVSQFYQFRRTNQLIGLADSALVIMVSVRTELDSARVERRAAVSAIGAVRTDLDALMDTGRRRSLANRQMIREAVREMRQQLDEVGAVMDSTRQALPKAKAKK